MKARFSEKQDAVKFTTIDGMTTVQICLNEQAEAVTPDDGDAYTEYVYDYNEWQEESVDQDAIKNAPEKYIDYVPAPKATAEQQRIADLEDLVTSIIGGNA